MKRFSQVFYLLFFIAMPMLLTSCVINGSMGNRVEGNRQVVNRIFPIEDYDEIRLSLPASVVYQQFADSTPYLQVNTDENIFSLLDIRVEGRTLILAARPNSNFSPSELTVYTSSHGLNLLALSGSGHILLKGEVNSQQFYLSISGSGNVRTDSLLCDHIEVKISGSGAAQLTGMANSGDFRITGSGDISAANYYLVNADCNITGSGDIDLRVSGHLNASVTGSGDITYRGRATVEQHVTGSGRIFYKRD